MTLFQTLLWMKLDCDHWKGDHIQVIWSPKPYYLIICKFFNCVFKGITFPFKLCSRQEVQMLSLLSVPQEMNLMQICITLNRGLRPGTLSVLSCSMSCFSLESPFWLCRFSYTSLQTGTCHIKVSQVKWMPECSSWCSVPAVISRYMCQLSFLFLHKFSLFHFYLVRLFSKMLRKRRKIRWIMQ